MKGPLSNRDFRLLLGGNALGQMLGPLQFLTQILWVQNHAPQDIWLILVALIGASRGLGALTFGLYGGALADRYDRRFLLLGIQALLVIVTCAIAALMFTGVGGIAGFTIFFALTFLGAGLQAVDMPTRLAIVPDILGPDLTPAGMSLNQVAVQVAMPLAMFATGFIIHGLGFGGAYLFSVIGHVVVILFLAFMRYEKSTVTDSAKHYGFGEAVRDVREGIRYARDHDVVLWLIVLLVLMMGFGFPATANLGPTWINTEVGVPVKDIGYVVMTWGIGSLLAALALTRYAKVARRGLLVGFGALLFCISFIVFVGDRTIANVMIGNLGLGAGMTITMVSSTILIQQLVPNEVRGRIMSLFQLNMGFAQLMTMPVAVLAQAVSLSVLFPILSGLTLMVVLGVLITQRQLLRA